MAVARPVNTTYLGAVKPIGSKILFNFNLGPSVGVGRAAYATWATGQTDVSYDFLISQDYIVTGLEVTKTVDDLVDADGTLGSLTVKVERINAAGTADTPAIAQCAFKLADRLQGLKQVAGNATAVVAVGASAGLTQIYRGGTVTDPEVAVQAEKKTTAGTANAQQRIRLTFSPAAIAESRMNPDCFVEIQLAKYDSTGQGLAAIQLGEVLTPENVAGVLFQ